MSRGIRCDFAREVPRAAVHMIGRVLVSFASAAAACATWAAVPKASSPHASIELVAPDSTFAALLAHDNPMIPALDRAYDDLELAMRPHGCAGCHSEADPTTDREARVQHAHHLLASRRAIVAMLEANLMPPARSDQPAGIADPMVRVALIWRARVFQLVGDAALSQQMRHGQR
jgi:hypothetical protein